jgi:hypothetical protein
MDTATAVMTTAMGVMTTVMWGAVMEGMHISMGAAMGLQGVDMLMARMPQVTTMPGMIIVTVMRGMRMVTPIMTMLDMIMLMMRWHMLLGLVSSFDGPLHIEYYASLVHSEGCIAVCTCRLGKSAEIDFEVLQIPLGSYPQCRY